MDKRSKNKDRNLEKERRCIDKWTTGVKTNREVWKKREGAQTNGQTESKQREKCGKREIN